MINRNYESIFKNSVGLQIRFKKKNNVIHLYRPYWEMIKKEKK